MPSWQMRLLAALSARADELPPDRDLYAQLDFSSTSRSSTTVAEAKHRDAAIVMLLERQALLSTRAALLRVLERPEFCDAVIS